ncbi:MAG: SDR family oxidoreductase [Rhodospirillales bacterium]|nr:SDR family oxidoreductase [Rhodospirillales bacterium]
MTGTKKKLFCFGLGYSALALIRSLRAEGGWRVAGTTRDEAGLAKLVGMGIEVVLFDGAHPIADLGAAIGGTTHLLSSIPPGASGDPALIHHAKDLADTDSIEWAGYLSTTGVYGDTGGATVDETARLNPSSDRSRHRVEAESGWLKLHHEWGFPVHVFRLAGIYGPGRSALDRVRGGTAQRIVKPGHAFGRIHVDDIAAVLTASMSRPDPGAVYNVCDDEPAAPAEVTAFACSLLEIEPPPEIPFEEAARSLSPMALSFWRDNRRVDNSKIRRDLSVDLSYPTYREGLSAILAAGG